ADDRMTLPEPGSYPYPEGVPAEQQAAPEVFTGWLFVFNYPEICVTSAEPPFCGPDDFNDRVRFGVHNFAGGTSSLAQHSGAGRPAPRDLHPHPVRRDGFVEAELTLEAYKHGLALAMCETVSVRRPQVV
ncbi:MAG: hypothetical protein ACC726_12855, partial [Chloroflexota bacterium]